MSTMFDSEKIEFECPNCGAKQRESIGRLKRDGYTCPSCGAASESSGLRKTLDEAEDMIRKFGR